MLIHGGRGKGTVGRMDNEGHGPLTTKLPGREAALAGPSFVSGSRWLPEAIVTPRRPPPAEQTLDSTCRTKGHPSP